MLADGRQCLRAEVVWVDRFGNVMLSVVVDETLGTLLTLGFLPAAAFGHWQAYAIAFFLFRLLDVWKPGLIGRSQELPRGWGIVVDDVLAGLLGGALLAVAGHAWPALLGLSA